MEKSHGNSFPSTSGYGSRFAIGTDARSDGTVGNYNRGGTERKREILLEEAKNENSSWEMRWWLCYFGR
jgi:hypothetical protein